jgi:uncharacterized membrane protein
MAGFCSLLADQVATDFWTSAGQAVISPLALIVSAAGIAVIVWGAYSSAVRLIAAEGATVRGQAPSSEGPPVRFLFLSYLLPGLEFLIAGGVIRTLVTPDWQQALALGSLVLARSLLGLSLKSEANAGAAVDGAIPRPKRLAAPPPSLEAPAEACDHSVLVGGPVPHS